MNYKIPVWVITALISLSISSAYAQIIEDPDRPGFVKDSYIITFKPPGQGKQPIVLPPKSKAERGHVPFGQHSSGQSKSALAAQLALNGEIIGVLEAMNAIYVHMSAEEAARFRRDNRVLKVHQGRIITNAGNLGSMDIDPDTGEKIEDWWALDRMDSPYPSSPSSFDKYYNDTSFDGSGRKIYVLDTGIAADNSEVDAQFRIDINNTRLTVYDLTPTSGTERHGLPPKYKDIDPNHPQAESFIPGATHGTVVAIGVGGRDYGTAKGATIFSVKVGTYAPSGGTVLHPDLVASDSNTETFAFNWLANYETPGTIVNWSRGVFDYDCSTFTEGDGTIDTLLETAMLNARNSGIIIVVAAHNDGCNTDGHTPVRLGRTDGVFVVGGTHNDSDFYHDKLAENIDVLFSKNEGTPSERRSRTGIDISVFAPAHEVMTLTVVQDEYYNEIAKQQLGSGTSMATALISGIFATACQFLAENSAPQYCDQIPPTAGIHPFYQLARDAATPNTVYDKNYNAISGLGKYFLQCYVG